MSVIAIAGQTRLAHTPSIMGSLPPALSVHTSYSISRHTTDNIAQLMQIASLISFASTQNCNDQDGMEIYKRKL